MNSEQADNTISIQIHLQSGVDETWKGIKAVEINGMLIVLDPKKETIRFKVYMAQEIAKGFTEIDALPIVEGRLTDYYVDMYKELAVKGIMDAYEKGEKNLMASLLCSLVSFTKGIKLEDFMKGIKDDPSNTSLDEVIINVWKDIFPYCKIEDMYEIL